MPTAPVTDAIKKLRLSVEVFSAILIIISNFQFAVRVCACSGITTGDDSDPSVFDHIVQIGGFFEKDHGSVRIAKTAG